MWGLCGRCSASPGFSQQGQVSASQSSALLQVAVSSALMRKTWFFLILAVIPRASSILLSGFSVVLSLPAPAEDQFWRGKTLGERGSGGSFQWQYHGTGRKPNGKVGSYKQQLGAEQTIGAQLDTPGHRGDKSIKNSVWFCFPEQYHALGLLYHVRKNDRLAVNKMLSKFTRHGLKSPFAYCMMIRVASKLLEEEAGRWGGSFPCRKNFLRSCFRLLLWDCLSSDESNYFCSLKSSVQLLTINC